MNRKPITALAVTYCVIVLVAGLLGPLTVSQSAHADGNGGGDPPHLNDSLDSLGNPLGTPDESGSGSLVMDLLLLYINVVV